MSLDDSATKPGQLLVIRVCMCVVCVCVCGVCVCVCAVLRNEHMICYI